MLREPRRSQREKSIGDLKNWSCRSNGKSGITDL